MTREPPSPAVFTSLFVECVQTLGTEDVKKHLPLGVPSTIQVTLKPKCCCFRNLTWCFVRRDSEKTGVGAGVGLWVQGKGNSTSRHRINFTGNQSWESHLHFTGAAKFHWLLDSRERDQEREGKIEREQEGDKRKKKKTVYNFNLSSQQVLSSSPWPHNVGSGSDGRF